MKYYKILKLHRKNLLEVYQDFKTDYGFYCRFIHISVFFKNEEEAFNCVNVQYFKTYNEFRYTSYNVFKEAVNFLNSLDDILEEN